MPAFCLSTICNLLRTAFCALRNLAPASPHLSLQQSDKLPFPLLTPTLNFPTPKLYVLLEISKTHCAIASLHAFAHMISIPGSSFLPCYTNF